MKKFYYFALMGAMVLTGMTFTACSSEEEIDVNPTFDGNTVKTDFAFSVSSNAKTRMTSDKTQADNTTFNGMKDMYLFSFSAVPAAGATATANFPLGTLTGISASASSKVYSLSIPVATNNFLFYGTSSAAGTNYEAGKLNSTLNESTTAVDNIKFSLQNIASAWSTDATNLAAYLTAVAAATGWAGTVSTAATDGAYQGIAQLYQKFTRIENSYSGSVESIKRMMLDLYRTCKAIHGESSVAGVKTIATAVCTAIETPTSGITVDITDTDTDPNNWTVSLTGVSDADFPAGASGLQLPMGAAQLSWTNASPAVCSYITTPYYAYGGTALTGTVDLSKICYPSQLVYFDNSPLLASNSYHKATDFPVTTGNWDTEPAGTTTGTVFTADWTRNGTVQTTTRSVAMQNNVNYGTALLQTTVKLEQNALTDNRAAMISGATNQTDVDGTKFQVTGILIGGQPAQVEWDMTHRTNTEFSNVIYDNDVTFKTTNLSTTATSPNYTIVLDNHTTAATQPNVLVALQIKNGDKDFYGINGLIPAGNTFYLVGELNVATASFTPATRATTYYRVTDETVKRAFIQDYKTVANFTLSPDALQSAYSTIPDLTTGQVVFGLSVDLNWEAGIEFNVEI